MKLYDFYNKIEEHEMLRGVCVDEDIFIERLNGNVLTKLSIDAVLNNDWEVLEPILLGEKEPENLVYMSRVVGYFSRIDNWNKSKIGELKDRHKGKYDIH